jgi:hypothetical protein
MRQEKDLVGGGASSAAAANPFQAVIGRLRLYLDCWCQEVERLDLKPLD